MTLNLTAGAAPVIHPLLLLAHKSSRKSGNIVHQVMATVGAAPATAVTLAAASLRSGQLTFLFPDETSAAAAEAAVKAAALITFADTDRASYNMTFVVAEGGDIVRELDPATRVRFTLSIDYQEVS